MINIPEGSMSLTVTLTSGGGQSVNSTTIILPRDGLYCNQNVEHNFLIFPPLQLLFVPVLKDLGLLRLIACLLLMFQFHQLAYWLE